MLSESGPIFIVFLAGYLLGSIPPAAFFLGRLWYHQDIKELGSGNPGATNTFRVFGALAGLTVLTADFLKGFLVLLVLSAALSALGTPAAQGQLLLGAAAVGLLIGHNWSLYMRFYGGKGVSVAAGVLTFLMGATMLIFLAAVWIITLLVGRYASLASLTAAVSFPILTALRFPANGPLLVVSLLITAAIIVSHRSNFARLLRGEELKIGLGKGQ